MITRYLPKNVDENSVEELARAKMREFITTSLVIQAADTAATP